jgi:hypothetical protein
MVPAMVVLLGMVPVVAKGTSVAVIVPTAIMGTIRNRKKANADIRVAAVVGLFGAASAVVGGTISDRLSDQVSNIMFAALLVFVAVTQLLSLRSKPVVRGPNPRFRRATERARTGRRRSPVTRQLLPCAGRPCRSRSPRSRPRGGRARPLRARIPSGDDTRGARGVPRRRHRSSTRSSPNTPRSCSARRALVFVYPTWWSGLPAILKGWLERVLVPGVGFVLDERTNKVRPGLGQVRHLVGISTYGSPRSYVRSSTTTGDGSSHGRCG